jgi:phosphate transport system substrate-binding protein
VTRDDDSGTTALFTRHLRAICSQFVTPLGTAGFNVRFPGSPAASLPSGSTQCVSYQNSTFNAGRWIAARGSEGVANCLDAKAPAQAAGSVRVNSRIGYLSPDFVRPSVNVQPYRGYALNTADVQNAALQFVPPTTAATAAALGTFPVPAGADRANPLAWVADPSGANPGTNPIADPPGATSYPIVGTTNFLFYTCYSSTAKAQVLARTGASEGFLNWFYGNRPGVGTILNTSGFTALPATLRNAIVATFANPADPSGLNLYIRPVTGAATPAPACNVGS